jgi:hypothetical protein
MVASRIFSKYGQKMSANNLKERLSFKGAQVRDFRSLRFSLFLHHKAFLGR